MDKKTLKEIMKMLRKDKTIKILYKPTEVEEEYLKLRGITVKEVTVDQKSLVVDYLVPYVYYEYNLEEEEVL